jgi:hypothetical protein
MFINKEDLMTTVLPSLSSKLVKFLNRSKDKEAKKVQNVLRDSTHAGDTV